MRGRSRRKKRTGKMVSLQKRFLAFMLAFAMIFTNVGTDLHVSFAASGNKVDFTIGGADLVDAIRQAIEDENVVSQDSLDFTDGATEKFEALFFGDGKVYEVYPDIQGDSMEAELRVFVKLPADADDTYMVTGEEEVYFLYVNNGEDTISCSTTVTRTENGKEKEKTTKRITIKSYEDKFGDEERNIISKPVETAPAETVPEEKPTEAVTGETTENVVNPTNVGAIFRSAAALNMDAVLLTSACSDPLYRRSIRVSMGTVFQVPWTYIENKNVSWPQGGMDLLHEYGFKTVAMALRNDSVRIDDEKLHAEEKLAIILGTEGDGLAAETMADCDYTVKIPMSHGVDSLNVAAASAVAFWEFGK